MAHRDVKECSALSCQLNPDIQDFYAFDQKNDVKLIGYEHMGKISFPLAQ